MREDAREAWREKDQGARDKCISNLVPGAGQAAAIAVWSKVVLATNIETGETVEYVSQIAAAHELGVSSATINRYKKNGKILKGKWLISVKV